MGLADVIASEGMKDERTVDAAEVEAISRFLRRVYKMVSDKVGDESANVLWNEVVKRERGRRKGSKIYDLSKLVSRYYAVSGKLSEKGMSKSAIVKIIADSAHKNSRGVYGSTAESINRKLFIEINENEKFFKRMAIQSISKADLEVLENWAITSNEDDKSAKP